MKGKQMLLRIQHFCEKVVMFLIGMAAGFFVLTASIPGKPMHEQLVCGFFFFLCIILFWKLFTSKR